MPGGVQTDGDLDDLEEALRDGVEEALHTTSTASLARIEQSFDQEETPMGTPWQPLSQVTLALKDNNDILTETGEMRDSFEAEVDANGLDGELSVGSKNWKLPYHEFGTEDIPRRPILDPLAEWWYHYAVDDVFAPALENEIDGVVL